MSAVVAALTCPRCGGRLPVSSPAILDCPACAAPLAVFLPGEPVREAVMPVKTREEVVSAARAFWKRKWVPEGFAADATLEEPILVFVPFHEIERTLAPASSDHGSASERLVRAPAVKIPSLPLENVEAESVLDEARRVPFDLPALQRRGLVFEADEKAPDRDGGTVLEERAGLVFIPVFLVRCRFVRNLYEAAVDGTTGRVFFGRAPTERSARLPQAIAFIYLFAFLVGMPLRGWGMVLQFLANFDEAGLVIGLFIPGLLVWLVAFAWDRLRFRYEWALEGRAVKLVPINKPEATLPERVRDGFFKVAAWIASR